MAHLVRPIGLGKRNVAYIPLFEPKLIQSMRHASLAGSLTLADTVGKGQAMQLP